jgi:hypothetical protein
MLYISIPRHAVRNYKGLHASKTDGEGGTLLYTPKTISFFHLLSRAGHCLFLSFLFFKDFGPWDLCLGGSYLAIS